MNPMNTAPRDGTMIRLQVEFAEHSLEDDNSKPIWTIGANGYDNDGQDVWQFAGWNWSHDCFTDGVGIPVGWLPMVEDPSKSWSTLYEELRAVIDGGSETMTHEDALTQVRAMKFDETSQVSAVDELTVLKAHCASLEAQAIEDQKFLRLYAGMLVFGQETCLPNGEDSTEEQIEAAIAAAVAKLNEEHAAKKGGN